MTGLFMTPLTVLALICYSLLYSGPVDGLFLAIVFCLRQYGLSWPLVMQTAATAIVIFMLFQIIRITKTSWAVADKTLIFPCKVEYSFAKFYPTKQIFSGRCLMVGVHVEREGNAKARKKLDGYLKGEGVDPSTYPNVYLITSPRYFGVRLNPVSLWYLYDADKCLAAMIVEVSENLSEQRMNYLRLDNDGVSSTFTFKSSQGSCKLATTDPLGDRGALVAHLELRSSNGHVKLASKLTSEGLGLDPSKMLMLNKLGFLMYWWLWVGLVTGPRVLKQKAMLMYLDGLHMWWTPRPLDGSTDRMANSIERQLEPIFQRYLRHLVDQSSASLNVKYVSSGILQDTDEVMSSAIVLRGSGAPEEMEVRVLSPLFYSRFVYYAHDLEAFFCELHESHTISVSRPDLLPKLLLRKPTTKLESSNLRQYVYFKLIQRLRVRPKPVGEAQAKGNVIDIRRFYISPIDAYVMANEDATSQTVYRNCVLKLFLADRISFRSVGLLEVGQLFLQAFLIGVFLS
ncbi:hypothetical protein QBC38DRAFT_469731 [Podospora fimiseda]|uniref:Uncharacterized protein n=1 Tax=Podospora fimiseda TaxID=252190 RepID=A0AAN7H698_9PEZI|nr:hypothetical protein QBC38DRAFT_469731 [Podospora fimiseda]